jgi:hypothetical protein
MDSIQFVRDYLDVATPGRVQIAQIRSYLADDVSIEDPMMPIEGADAFIAALGQTGSGEGMRSTVQDVVGSDDVVAARILFEMMGRQIQFCQWFWLSDEKIQRIQVVYDPRPFLEVASAGLG